MDIELQQFLENEKERPRSTGGMIRLSDSLREVGLMFYKLRREGKEVDQKRLELLFDEIESSNIS